MMAPSTPGAELAGSYRLLKITASIGRMFRAERLDSNSAVAIWSSTRSRWAIAGV
jgi:hypothetical protein